jgi:hypothetical protein
MPIVVNLIQVCDLCGGDIPRSGASQLGFEGYLGRYTGQTAVKIRFSTFSTRKNICFCHLFTFFLIKYERRVVLYAPCVMFYASRVDVYAPLVMFYASRVVFYAPCVDVYAPLVMVYAPPDSGRLSSKPPALRLFLVSADYKTSR